MVKYFCDACGKESECPMVTRYKRGNLPEKVYDLCNFCDAAINDILSGMPGNTQVTEA